MKMSWDEFVMLMQDVRTSLPKEAKGSEKIRFTVKLSNTDEVSMIYDGVTVDEDGTVNVMFATEDIYANGEDDETPLGEDNYRLTDDEYNVLNLLSALSKMDCWFCLTMDENETYDYVEDLENDETMTLRAGVAQLNEGLIEENLAQLSDKGRKTYKKLLIKLGI